MTFWRVRATVDDRPGYLSVLTASLALRSVNILSVAVHATEAGAVDDFLVDAPDKLTEADLLAAVTKGRGRDAWVSRTDVRGLVDSQTQLLGVAARLVRDPGELGAALTALLGGGHLGPNGPVARPGGCTVTWVPRACPADRDFGERTMRLPDPAGGTLIVARDEPAFTPAELARAHALVDLAAAVVGQAAGRWQVLLPDGEELTVRQAGPEDGEAVQALRARCSPRVGHRRSGRQPSRLLEAPHAITLIAEQGSGGRVVAMVSVLPDGTEAEIGLLVADGYRRRGLGTALLHRAARLATGLGIEALHAYTDPADVAMVATLRRLGRPVSQATDGPILSLTVDLRPAGDPEPPTPGVTGRTGTPYQVR